MEEVSWAGLFLEQLRKHPRKAGDELFIYIFGKNRKELDEEFARLTQ